MTEARDPALTALAKMIGTWRTEARHPSMPGVVVHGIVTVEWLEGEHFLIHRGRNDDKRFPDSVSILGFMELDRVGEGKPELKPQLEMHYFDSRGVSRVYQMRVDKHAWHVWRDAPGFSQRFEGKLSSDNNTIQGLWHLNEDNQTWSEDLKIDYHRQA